MRRAEVDSGSQPVRNLLTNPSAETTGSVAVTRTNHATDPRATSYTVASGGIGWINTRWFGTGSGAGNYTLVTGAVDGPLPEITTYARKTWTVAPSSNGDTGFGNTNGGATAPSAVAAAPYTVSAYVRTSASGKTNAAMVIQWLDTNNAVISTVTGTLVALTAGAWTRLSATGTAPTGTVRMQIITDVDGGTAWAPGDTLDGTGLLVEITVNLTEYFDGATPAAGDFTYVWSGTANASTSLQRGTLLAGFSHSNAVAIRSTEWSASGSSSIRVIPSIGANNDSYCIVTYPWQAKTYTILAKCRLSAPLVGTPTGNGSRQIWAVGTGGTSVSVRSTQQANSAGVEVHRVTWTFNANNTFKDVRLYTGVARGGGDTWWDDIMLVEGNYQGDFIDGTKPFSKWDGAANASTSVGYPPQLLDIAGKPIVDVTASATYTLDDSFGPTEGRTFYTVIDTLAEVTGAISPVLHYGDSVLNDTVANTYIQYRQDNNTASDGVNNLLLRRTGGGGVVKNATIRRHVGVWGCNSSGQLYHGIDGATPSTDASVTMSLLHQKLVVFADDAWHKHLRTIAYRGVHDDATRLAISRYLGNKYGAKIA